MSGLGKRVAFSARRAAVGAVGLIPGLLMFVALACPLQATAQEARPVEKMEKVEWTWSDRPDVIVVGLPDILLVGDSITRNYYPFVARSLSGRANVFLFSTSAALGDARLPRQLTDYVQMAGRRFAVVHFNNGMHGWAYSEADYAAAAPGFVAALHAAAPLAKLIWASTTAVRADADGGPTNARIEARNAAVARTMAASSIPIDDQHALMRGHTPLYSDDVHFSDDGAALQAASAVRSITTALP